jgi:hypothetical protein
MGLALLVSALPSGAQGTVPVVFATNTPVVEPRYSPAMSAPDAPYEQYALRQWLESDLLDVLRYWVSHLNSDDPRGPQAVQLLQYELARRFPGAPHDASQRNYLIAAMLTAPRGSVDLRGGVRPFVAALLTQRAAEQVHFDSEYGGWLIEEKTANVDGADPLDAMIHVRYPATAPDSAHALYDDYVLAQVDTRRVYHILDTSPSIPAAPFGAIRGIALERFGDLNNDGHDELAISVDRGDVNRQMVIVGWRNDGLIHLIAPSQTLLFAKTRSWSDDGATLKTVQDRVDSPAWNCISEEDVDWIYSSGFFRPAQTPAGAPAPKYQHQDTLACHLFENEPLFEKPGSDIIQTVQDLLAQAAGDQSQSDYSYQRAQMTLAMLYALDGQPTQATQIAGQLQQSAPPGSWLEGQANAFMNTITQSSATPLALCEALLAADRYGACDMDQVLAYLFKDQPLNRDETVLAQLAERNIPVLESTTITQVGHADRIAVSFNLTGASWWAFAPVSRQAYSAERIDPPPGFEPATLPQEQIAPPQPALDALLVQNDPIGALNVLGNALRDNPGIPLSPAALYVQALSYDLTADRLKAKRAYFNLWKQYPDSPWGQLAAAHLEEH